MTIFRMVAAVLVGYLVFGLASMFVVSRLATGEVSLSAVVVFAALAVIGLLSGLATGVIAGTKRRLAGAIVAALVGVATLANLALQLGSEPTWYKVATWVLTVPSILAVTLRRPRDENAT